VFNAEPEDLVMMKCCFALAQIFVVGVLMAGAGSAAAQSEYPNKPIRFIVPYPPGGGSDVLARLIGQKLTESWGQPVIIDNRAGANTIIGTDALVKAPPNGYTISLAASTLAVLPHLYRDLPYDPLKDVAPVATVSMSPQLLVVNSGVAANNLEEFIALAKSMPGKLNYASSGAGGPTHLAAALFEILAGVKMQHVAYKGTGPGLTDLLAGRVQLWFIGPHNAIPHIKTGRLRPLAITGESRSASLPQTQTFAEAGMPDFDMETWYGVLAPAGTPKEIVDKLSIEIGKILAMPDVREKLETQGMRPFVSTPEQFTALVKSDVARYGKIIKTANIERD
jgi:tripartite-type tricarboxylate transporter receptor subunit TctC